MKPVRGSKPAGGDKPGEPSLPNPLADSIEMMIEQQRIGVQQFEQHRLETLKLTQQWLEALHDELNALLDRMQTAAARSGMKRAFNASPEQLGKVAVIAARKRG